MTPLSQRLHFICTIYILFYFIYNCLRGHLFVAVKYDGLKGSLTKDNKKHKEQQNCINV